MTRPRTNPIFEALGRAVVSVLTQGNSFIEDRSLATDEWKRKEWLASALWGRSTDAAKYINQKRGYYSPGGSSHAAPPLVVDPHSHDSHIMRPINRHLEGTEQPPERHVFRCAACGALDLTKRAAAPCPRTVP